MNGRIVDIPHAFVGAAEGCDLLIVKNQIKTSQRAAAPAEFDSQPSLLLIKTASRGHRWSNKPFRY
jgi:hypothetical protein